MKRELVLFCGGPAIFGDGVPKPLLPVQADRSLIEHYLGQVDPSQYVSVTLLVERAHVEPFRAAIARASPTVPSRLLVIDDGASTLRKLQAFTTTDLGPNRVLEFSYPDLFFDGDPGFDRLDPQVLEHQVLISQIPVNSRFPRLMIDEYSGEVRGISRHVSAVPANPYYIFGGHLLALPERLRVLLEDFGAEYDLAVASLEFDFLSWLINRDLVIAHPLYGRMIHADTPRDLLQLQGWVPPWQASPQLHS